jgi:hypothetical protein
VKSQEDILRPDAIEHAHECGTTACAMGWAVTIPEFRRDGLTLINVGVGDFMSMSPCFDSRLGYHAADAFFGIPHDIALHFFSPSAYINEPGPEDVANRIDLFLSLDDKSYYLKAIDMHHHGFCQSDEVDPDLDCHDYEPTENDLASLAAANTLRSKLPSSSW